MFVKKLHVWVKSGNNIPYLLLEDVSLYSCSSTKYFVARQQRKGNPLLHIHSKTEHFHSVDSYIWISYNKTGTYCCVSMAKAVTQRRHNATLQYVHCLSCFFVNCNMRYDEMEYACSAKAVRNSLLRSAKKQTVKHLCLDFRMPCVLFQCVIFHLLISVFAINYPRPSNFLRSCVAHSAPAASLTTGVRFPPAVTGMILKCIYQDSEHTTAI